MLVEKLICNARLNLLILHPFPAPTSCPSRQEPNSLSIPRCQGIKISMCRRRGREEETRGEGKKGEGQRVLAHMSQIWTAGGREGYKCSLWFSPIPAQNPSPLKSFIYKHYTVIYQQQTKHVTPPSRIPPPLHTHMHAGQRRCPEERSQWESIKEW